MLQIPNRPSSLRRSGWLIASLMVFFLLLLLMLHSWRLLTQGADQPINMATADTGDVLAVVSGQGRLLPRQSSSVMAEVDGVIQHLLLYPGSVIQPGDVLLTMRNPLLERERERAELAVLEARAAREAALAKLERESIALENEVAMQEAEIRFGEQEMETLQALLEQQILARLDYLRAQTKLEQSRLRHNLSERNILAFKRARTADERAYQYRLQEAEKQLTMIEQDIRQLEIRAETAGLLNELAEHIEVGKPIRRGDIIAQITDPNTLYVDLLIAAADATRVQAGQQVQVQIRQHQLTGEVLRIHPSIQHSQVRIEVLLPSELPAEARANLDISARIVIASAEQVIRIASPLGVREGHQTVALYIQNGEGFQRREVQIGVLGREHMEVLNGLLPGDRILLDAPKQHSDPNYITFKELRGG